MDNFDAYSDAFKDWHGFRPRGGLAAAFLALDPAGQTAAIDAAHEGWRLETAREASRREADRVTFRAKVAALGLDPDKYMHLAS